MAEAQVEGREEEEEEECPKCPPAGAPAWMATFADMATLLMAFFVLILSFAEFNVPKFKQISGSLKNAFGIQRIVPVVEQPKGTTVLSLDFSPSPAPSVTKNLTQQTTDAEQKNLDLKSEIEDLKKELAIAKMPKPQQPIIKGKAYPKNSLEAKYLKLETELKDITKKLTDKNKEINKLTNQVKKQATVIETKTTSNKSLNMHIDDV